MAALLGVYVLANLHTQFRDCRGTDKTPIFNIQYLTSVLYYRVYYPPYYMLQQLYSCILY
jgi:hypothetical protein